VSQPTLEPEITTDIPGPVSLEMGERLARAEARGVTCLDPPPIFWRRAQGCNVWDVDGNRFVDLTAAFGVANVGHAHPEVVDAISRQAGELLHGMGDVYPPDVKLELIEAIARRYPGGGEARVILGTSGSDAVESAIKTAQLASGRPGILAFEGAYHGLAFGALDTTFREDFRSPFAARLPNQTVFAPYGDLEAAKQAAASCDFEIGAVLVEPVQGRGGERVPPRGFLSALADWCRESGRLLVADEIYTGFGRTGCWFACEHEDVVPDLLCMGKGMASGMPISACAGRREVMDAWPTSTGEALHTQTFLGHPAGCAAALASMQVMEREGLVARAAETGAALLAHLETRCKEVASVREVRGKGLMIGIEVDHDGGAVRACEAALRRGVIALPSGPRAEVVSLTPPLSIDEHALRRAADVIVECLA
jgi:4-aminobutyrate aminotransferase-like enzyme